LAKKRSRSSRSPRKKSAARRPSSRRPEERKVIKLKPIYEQVGRTLVQLRLAPPSDVVRGAIERLEKCRQDIDDICGPTMAIPIVPAPPA